MNYTEIELDWTNSDDENAENNINSNIKRNPKISYMD